MNATETPTLSRLAEKYLNDIAVADGPTLHSLIVDARADIRLSGEEVDEIQAAVGTRYARINAAAMPPQKARWS